jgi:hypothetical protein
MSMLTPITRRARLRGAERGQQRAVGSISPEGGDAILYGVGAIFALITILTSNEALYRQWANLAIGPFLFGAVAGGGLVLLARRRKAKGNDAVSSRRSWTVRILLATCVFAGATAIPLGLEILWRADNDPGSHFQPEVSVSSEAARRWPRARTPITR